MFGRSRKSPAAPVPAAPPVTGDGPLRTIADFDISLPNGCRPVAMDGPDSDGWAARVAAEATGDPARRAEIADALAALQEQNRRIGDQRGIAVVCVEPDPEPRISFALNITREEVPANVTARDALRRFESAKKYAAPNERVDDVVSFTHPIDAGTMVGAYVRSTFTDPDTGARQQEARCAMTVLPPRCSQALTFIFTTAPADPAAFVPDMKAYVATLTVEFDGADRHPQEEP